MVLLGLVIVVVHINAELHFLHHDLGLMLLRLPLLFLLLIQIFSVVHDAAYGGLGGRRNLDQVQILLAGFLERVIWGHDSHLLALVVNHADFAGANAIIGADKAFIDTVLQR